MGYSTDESMVRVDFFSIYEHGGYKWYSTEEVKWKTYNSYSPIAKNGLLIDDAFCEALKSYLGGTKEKHRHQGMIAVCLKPYHEHSFPLAIPVDWAYKEDKMRSE